MTSCQISVGEIHAYRKLMQDRAVCPSAMEKLYKTYQRATGSMLWDLVTSPKTTMRTLQDHFHRAQQAASSFPQIAQRIAAHWMEMTRYFESVQLLTAYYRKLLTVKGGRGLPQLLDRDILLLTLSEAFNREAGQENDTKDFSMAMEKMAKSVDTMKDQVSEFKSKLSEMKSDVSNLKNEMKELKKKRGDKFCTYCGGTNHTEEYCHQKKADAKKAKEEE